MHEDEKVSEIAQSILTAAQSYEPPNNLDGLAARIENGQTQLRELDHSLYAADTSNWNGTVLWNEFRHGLQEKRMARINQDDGLNPLYPQHH